MRRSVQLASALTLAVVTAAGGYWAGFKDGWRFGLDGDSLPRGAISVAQLHELQAGRTANVVTMLEGDVDHGLINAGPVLEHPLRPLLPALWGWDVYPDYEKYVVRLANYRKTHPSQMTATMFDKVPAGRPADPEFQARLAADVRINIDTINRTVERYADKP